MSFPGSLACDRPFQRGSAFPAFAVSLPLLTPFKPGVGKRFHCNQNRFPCRKRPRHPYLSPTCLATSSDIQASKVSGPFPGLPQGSQSEGSGSESLSEASAESDIPKAAPARDRRKRVVSPETRRRISFAMLGKPKSQAMRAKVSESMKGRIPWNKGKKLSPEIRARMSEAHCGRVPWNKGKGLTSNHRRAISTAMKNTNITISSETRQRMRMARRRPGDAILQASVGHRTVGGYPLVESAGINSFITLRRELRVWSDKFKTRNSRRPSLADIRRSAPVSIIRKFEKYVAMRNQIRGLASDVYGSVNPKDVPVVPTGEVSSAPRNNNGMRTIHVTKHGNPRFISTPSDNVTDNVGYCDGSNTMEGALQDMWDMYDRPATRNNSERDQNNHTLIGDHEAKKTADQLGPNDYRMIGRYRLMESLDIHHFMKLRKELQNWSDEFKRKHGRKPALSDARAEGRPALYHRFCDYLELRSRMTGLVKEVYGTEVDDLETLTKVNEKGKVILDTLRSATTAAEDEDNIPH
ncbi:hypothetical protein BWQ96_03990 [Gracilariopsis chorda]|uniref:Nuclease associated modular domain-containing protein n=1 Tax=Gracilariopsis chorda TaxID=448386 RepID=A0A2V3IW18_9FLOR|nr:hypothetical protein BWQ96_03990 [Gracilariopsis chorda]|eukprot:PXF46334.1 hypothetical protein BWQ96_03990 [Gracilariopsis chorda]